MPSASAPATSTNTADRLLKCRQQATSTARAAKRKASGPLPGTLHRQFGREGGSQSGRVQVEGANRGAWMSELHCAPCAACQTPRGPACRGAPHLQ